MHTSRIVCVWCGVVRWCRRSKKNAAQTSMPMKNYGLSVSVLLLNPKLAPSCMCSNSRRCRVEFSFLLKSNFSIGFCCMGYRYVGFQRIWSLTSLRHSSTYLSGAVTEVHWLLWKGKMETSVFCWLSHYIDWFLMPSCYFWCRNRHPNSNRISNTSYSIKSYFLLLPASKNYIFAHAQKISFVLKQ